MPDKEFKFTVNGQPRSVTTDPQRPLLEVLREEFNLTGTKFGCGEGQCAACTVLVEGKTTYSCLTDIEEVDGKAVTTIEGLAKENKLHPVQEAFLAEGAYQCGYCIPGMIMASVALLTDNAKPTDAQIRTKLNSHLCRCCGYPKIINAVKRAAGGGGGEK